MSSCRLTNPQGLWLTLLFAFALYAIDGVPAGWDGSGAFGCEPEIKAVAMEPDRDISPASGMHEYGTFTNIPADRRGPARNEQHARHEAVRTDPIRGPPGGYRIPA